MTQEVELTGVVRGKRTIELDEEISWPEGHRVRLRVVLDSGEGGKVPAREDPEAEKTLQTINQMRHQGRSIRKP